MDTLYEGWFVLLALVIGMTITYAFSADVALIRQMRKAARANKDNSPVVLEVTRRDKWFFTYVLDNPDFCGHKTFTDCSDASTFLIHHRKAQKTQQPKKNSVSVWR